MKFKHNSKEYNWLQTCHQPKNALMHYNSLKVRKLTYIFLTFDCISIELIIISLFVATFILANGHGVTSNIDAPCDLLLNKGLLGGGD